MNKQRYTFQLIKPYITKFERYMFMANLQYTLEVSALHYGWSNWCTIYYNHNKDTHIEHIKYIRNNFDFSLARARKYQGVWDNLL